MADAAALVAAADVQVAPVVIVPVVVPSMVDVIPAPRVETAEARTARQSDCVSRHIQCVKPEYLLETHRVGLVDDRDASKPPAAKKQRGQNTKRPREAKGDVAKTQGDPAGLADEANRLDLSVIRLLRSKKYDYWPEPPFGRAADPDAGVAAAIAADAAALAAVPESAAAWAGTPALRERKLVDFRGKVYVAPLTTVGNLPFRRILTKYGADITCGEMAVADNLLQGQASEWALLRRHSEEKCFGVQVACSNPEKMAHLGELLTKYCAVDFVDINMGCPIDLICNQGMGAALMTKTGKMQSVVEAALGSFPGSVTFKMRTGWKDDTPIAHTLAGLGQSWSASFEGRIAAIFVHGRSRLARYSRSANWEYIDHVAESQDDCVPSIPIVGNGDVFSWADFSEKRAAAPHAADTAMLARGALIKPWLPTEIKEQRAWDISSGERLDVLKDFARFGLDHWGADECGVARTRRFLLEWLSFLYRYTPVGLLDVLPQRLNDRPPAFVGRNDLETLMASTNAEDWVTLSNLVLPPAPDNFNFLPKHRSNAFDNGGNSQALSEWG